MKTFWITLYKSTLNLIKWIPIIWNDRDWDWYYLIVLIQFKIKKMEKYHRITNGFVGVEQTIKQLNICNHLLQRIKNDNYCLNPHYEFLIKINRKKAYKWVMEYEQQDMDLLFKIINKHLKYWWD